MRFVEFCSRSAVVLVCITFARLAYGEDSKDFEPFLAAQEKASEAGRQKLLRAIENVAKDIQRATLDPGEKQIQLDAIERDREALANGNKLPSSDALLGA